MNAFTPEDVQVLIHSLASDASSRSPVLSYRLLSCSCLTFTSATNGQVGHGVEYALGRSRICAVLLVSSAAGGDRGGGSGTAQHISLVALHRPGTHSNRSMR